MLILTTIRDIKTGSYSQPMAYKSAGEALRSFADICSDSNTLLNKHPKDFSMLRIGTYDQSNALINVEQPSHLGDATEYVPLQKNLLEQHQM